MYITVDCALTCACTCSSSCHEKRGVYEQRNPKRGVGQGGGTALLVRVIFLISTYKLLLAQVSTYSISLILVR